MPRLPEMAFDYIGPRVARRLLTGPLGLGEDRPVEWLLWWGWWPGGLDRGLDLDGCAWQVFFWPSLLRGSFKPRGGHLQRQSQFYGGCVFSATGAIPGRRVDQGTP